MLQVCKDKRILSVSKGLQMKTRIVKSVDVDQEALCCGRIQFTDGYNIMLPGKFVKIEYKYKPQDIQNNLDWRDRMQKLCAQTRTSLLNPGDKVKFVEYSEAGMNFVIAYIAKGLLHFTGELSGLDDVITSLSFRDWLCLSGALFKENIKSGHVPSLSAVRNYKKLKYDELRMAHRLSMLSH